MAVPLTEQKAESRSFAGVTRTQWNTLLAAKAGWMLDAMDVMLYAFALTTLKTEFAFSDAQAGLVASATLFTAAAGGIGFGVIADQFGRRRALSFTLLIYSLGSAATATVGLWQPSFFTPLVQLIFWRSFLGIGMGGEWACGAALVAETWPAHLRGRAIAVMQSGWAIGYIIAAMLAAAILPQFGWRVLFLVGVFPALLIVWIRRHVPETLVHSLASERASPLEIFSPQFRSFTLRAGAVAVCVLIAYWGVFTWLPGFLASPVEKGGAGLSIAKSSGWIIPAQIGAYFGYLSFGFIADRLGRKPAFILYLLITAAVTPLYGYLARNAALLLALGPVLGFFGHGYFSLFGAMVSELYPQRIRATALGVIYNIGRAASAAAPWLVGALADRYGIGSALGVTSLFLLAGAALMLTLPETRGRDLA
ncbi:MAG TPA: MFS transporter [Blastocatellia bacterium]|nr:MFS transporter [Blastocatellia bacterium]